MSLLSVNVCLTTAVLWIFITSSIQANSIQQDYLAEGNLAEGNLAERSAEECEGKNLTFECVNGIIRIIRVAYKIAPPTSRCGSSESSSGSPDTSCSAKAQQHVSRMCDNETSCGVEVRRDLFVSSCSNTTPTHLIVQYNCLSTEVETVRDREQWTTPGFEGTCPMMERRDVVWPETWAGTTAQRQCPNYAEGVARWRCGSKPVRWIDDPDLQECVSPVIRRLGSEVLSQRGAKFNRSTYRTLVSRMVSYTSEEQIYGGDIYTLASTMRELVSQVNLTLKELDRGEDVRGLVADVAEAILQTSSNLLRGDIWADLPRNIWHTGANQILTSVESSAFQLAEINRPSFNITANIVLQVQVMQSSGTQDLLFPPASSLQDTSWQSSSTAIRLTKDTIVELSEQGRANVVFAMYKNVASLLTPSSVGGANESNSEQPDSVCSQFSNCSAVKRFVNSHVISASVNAPHTGKRVNLKNEIVFTLEHITVDNATNATCAFWEYSEEKQSGDWSTEGCRVVGSESNATQTTCACKHLTSFAIIMSPTQPQISAANEFALSIITYFGCIISIICLLLAFITFQAFRNLQCDRNTIHKNLCLTLLIANIVFIAGIMQYNIPVLCSIVAAVLHYFFLAAFAWMCLEGIQLYIMLVEVFEAEKSRVVWYYVGAYGCPAIIVATSAAVYHQGYGTDTHCWLSTERGFVWSFLAPAICIIVVNSFMLGVAIRAMMRHAKSAAALRMKEKTKIEQIRLWLKGTIILVFLLGLTWLFGLMYVSGSTVVFAYIFTILNSLQGLFIFIFHCVMNDKVRTEYRKFIRRSTWLPESFRNKYGEKSKSAVYSSTPNRSSDQPGKGFDKLTAYKNTDSSALTNLSKSTSSPRNSSDNHRNTNNEMPALIHAAVDSGIDDPPSYTEAPPTAKHHRENETTINGNTVSDDVTDDDVTSPREPSTADYLETIKDRRRIADSLSDRYTPPVQVDSDFNPESNVEESIPTTADLLLQRSRAPVDRHVSGSSDEEDFGHEPGRSLMKKKVERLSSVTAV